MSLRALFAKQSPRRSKEIAHLHCTTPALAGGARERSAAQVSTGERRLATTYVKFVYLYHYFGMY